MLEEGHFPKLKQIEIPVFDEDLAAYLDIMSSRKDSEIKGVKLCFRNNADVLGFSGEAMHHYNLCILNPGDAHSYPGNNLGCVWVIVGAG